MGDFLLYIMTAVSLVFVIEGLIYALFPDVIKHMMTMALNMNNNILRGCGLAVAGTGFLLVWLISVFSGPAAP